MKKLVVLFTFLCVLSLQAQEYYWTSISGQIPGDILTVEADSAGNLFASTSENKIYRSSDAGLSWQFLYQTLFPIIKFNITSNLEIFATGGMNYIFYSSDHGNSWEIRNSGIKWFDEVLTIAKTPTGKLIAGTLTGCLSCAGGGLYYSLDNGQNWIFLDLLHNSINSIITGFDSKIYAAGGGGVFLSIDDGISWQLKNSGMQPYEFIKYLAIGDDSTIFAATEMYGGLMYKSSDQGENWIQSNSGLPNDEINGLEIENNLLFASYDNAGIFRSSDEGNSWINVGNEIPNFYFNSINRYIDGNILVATSGGIYKSNNSGLSWVKLTKSLSHLAVTSINCSNSSNIFVGTENGGIFHSTDLGANWEQNELITTDNGYEVNDIVYQSENKIYASIHGYVINKSLFSSSNDGKSWIEEGIDNTEYGITCFYIDENNKMFAGEFSKIYWSFDNGQQWLTTPLTTAQSWVYDIISNSNGIILAATYGNGIYRSINNGNIFNFSGLANQHVHSVEVDNNGNFYAGSDGIYKSTDTGITWTLVLPPTIISTVYDIKITKNNIITAAGGGFYFSTDDGNTWESVPNGIENTVLTSISIDSSDNIFVGSYSGIYMLNKPLPVELLTFSSSVVDNDITLNWTTATEINNSGFDIERKQVFTPQSTVGNEEWESIGFVYGHGTTTEPQTYSFIDENISAGKYQYRLKQIDFDGTFEYSNIVEAEINSPAKFSLEQNFPNPFNPSTKISWQSPVSSWQILKVYDILANEVAILVNEYKPAGNYEVEFNGTELPSGIYFYQLKAGSFIETKKMILLK